METRANYVTVGAFVLVLLLAMIVASLWLAKWQSERRYMQYDILFSHSVQGLKRGSTVNYQGLNVGEVVSVGIDQAEPSRVRVVIEVAASTPVREDTVATLEYQGITGGVAIQLSSAPADSPVLVAKAGQKRPVIRSGTSGLERVLASAPQLIDRIDLLVQRGVMTLSEDNIRSVTETLHNLSDLTGTLAKSAGKVDGVVDQAGASLGQLREASEAAARMAKQLETDLHQMTGEATSTVRAFHGTADKADQLIGDLRGTAKAATKAADAAAGMANEARALVKENRAPVTDFANTGLYELTGILSDLRVLVSGLQRVLNEVDRDPAHFLFGGRREGYEAR